MQLFSRNRIHNASRHLAPRQSLHSSSHKAGLSRFTGHARAVITIFVLLGVSTNAGAWVGGTPYFFDRFPNLMSAPDVPSAPGQPNAARLAIGASHSFFSIDFKTHQQYTVKATLRAVGKFCYLFVEDSQWKSRTVTAADVESMRRAFDDAVPANPAQGIYQTETTLFGPPPDIDGDPRIYILLLDIRDGGNVGGGFIAGFFNPIDQQRGVLQHPELGVPIRSNERDMVYIDTRPLNVGGREGQGVLAHEFQHLIHWRHDRDEETWVNEGCSDYAMFLCGYAARSHVEGFEKTPDVSLTSWPKGIVSQLAHYGAAYLWMLYLHEHYGDSETIVAIVKNRGNGIIGINNALRARGVLKPFSTIFADWKIANFLDDTEFALGQYGYRNLRLNTRVKQTHRSYPVTVDGTALPAYASHYIAFTPSSGGSGLNLSFSASDKMPYDVKAVIFQGGKPVAVQEMPLTNTGQGHLIISKFGSVVEKVVLVPSTQPKEDFFFPARTPSSYDYRAKLGSRVTFRTSVLPNPIHSRYQDIIAIPNDPIGATPPTITITAGNRVVTSKQPMKAVQQGTIYTYSLYLSPDVHPEEVRWQVLFFDELIGEGKLEKN